MESLDHKLPVRVSILVVNAVAFGLMFWGILREPEAASHLVQLYTFFSGVCGVAIGGDSLRPSGKVKVS